MTQETCSWLLAHPIIISGIHDAIISGEIQEVGQAEFSSGPIRLAMSMDKRVAVIWNRDYLSGTGTEAWGILELDGPFGILNRLEISNQVLERQLYVFSQRLQGLIVDSDYIHRTWPNGSHTCLAGRGNEARQYSISYYEAAPGFSGLASKAIISIGPTHDFDILHNAIAERIPLIGDIARAANEVVESRRRPLIDSPRFSMLRAALTPTAAIEARFGQVSLKTSYDQHRSDVAPYETIHWSYDQWIGSDALNEAQRRILSSNVLHKHPVRVIGPAGSGKTLIMQLLALKHLQDARESDRNVKVLYVVHNAPMAQMVTDRMRTLGGDEFLTNSSQELVVTTLSEYGRRKIGVEETMVIDKDAHSTKAWQLEQVRIALRAVLDDDNNYDKNSTLISQVAQNDDLFNIFSILVMAEISNVIKGRGLGDDEKRYVNSETALSRLHRIMNPYERSITFRCYQQYHRYVFEQFELLDSDDVALSLLGRLRTPVWQLRRKSEGYDFIFVDEAQLFNENERKIFPSLSKGTTGHIPIALALDEAQEPFGFSNAGLATLGIVDAESENLPSNHRSTREIVELAFYVIQRTTDLFGTDFPDFNALEAGVLDSSHSAAAPPCIIRCNEDARSFGRFLVKQVQKLRAKNVRQICVVCHAETYWSDLVEAFERSQLPLHVIAQRGEKITPDQPLVILSRPAYVGGQEFDAVISVGLEQGVVPPRIVDNPPLSAAVEQQILREMYLSITRARYRYIVALNRSAVPNSIISDACQQKHIRFDDD